MYDVVIVKFQPLNCCYVLLLMCRCNRLVRGGHVMWLKNTDYYTNKMIG